VGDDVPRSLTVPGSERIRVLVVAGRTVEAVDEADRQLATDPFDVDVLTWAAIARSELGDHEVAVDLACQAVAADPERALPHRLLSNLLVHAGRRREAVAEARLATTLAPDDPMAWISLAEAAHSRRRSTGHDAARRALELAPDSSAAWNALAINSRGRARARALRRALELDPSMTPARLNLASTQRRLRPGAMTDVAVDLARESPGDHAAHLRVLAAAGARRQACWLLALGVALSIVSLWSDAGWSPWAVGMIAVGMWRLLGSRHHRATLRAVTEEARGGVRARREGAIDGEPAGHDPAIRPALRRRAERWTALALFGVAAWTALVVLDEPTPGAPVVAVVIALMVVVTVHAVVLAWCTFVEVAIRVVLRRRPWAPWAATAGTVANDRTRMAAVLIDGPEGREQLVRVGPRNSSSIELSRAGRVRIALGARFAVVEAGDPARVYLVRRAFSVAAHAKWGLSFRSGPPGP